VQHVIEGKRKASGTDDTMLKYVVDSVTNPMQTVDRITRSVSADKNTLKQNLMQDHLEQRRRGSSDGANLDLEDPDAGIMFVILMIFFSVIQSIKFVFNYLICYYRIYCI